MNIREEFLRFFKENGHTIYESMNLVPNDPSLLFTNAGMVQFKDIFTGLIPANESRATSSQLCIRVGGKHNDLENVGYTNRHHTLFEMLGNFSFGDYFKVDAINYAWEFITKNLELPKKRLYITVHESDDEAFKIWSKIVSSDHIKFMGDKDNFWQMGDVGPCGPCSEIFFDQGEKYFKGKNDYFGGDGDRFLEIWNLVFMQFQKDSNGKLTPLPKPSIDTGMGLERIQAIIEGKISNFDSNIFAPLLSQIEIISKQEYGNNPSFRVIADHARAVAFLLSHGVNFNKEGRGYVARRILRRALRHGYLLGIKEAFLYKVIECLIENMKSNYQYLDSQKENIKNLCKDEEDRFYEMLHLGMDLFQKEFSILKSKKEKKFSGQIAFKLYDTYGFPLDLTQDMLINTGINIDMYEFESCMNKQKKTSKAHWKGSGDIKTSGEFEKLIEIFKNKDYRNEFIGYEHLESESKALFILDSNFKLINELKKEEEGYVLFDKTPFYPESGGAVGDSGIILESNSKIADVLDTNKYFEFNISKIRAYSNIKINSIFVLKVSNRRNEIAKHHSATHILNATLREILGTHIVQAGSLVEDSKLRFDFTHNKALSVEELEKIQTRVNEIINLALEAKTEIMDIDEAKSRGAIAMFNEKYGKKVRVLTFGNENKIYSMELCGGVHVKNTAFIGNFFIIKESSVSSGVRRIEAICGKSAYEYCKENLILISNIKKELKNNDIINGIKKLKDKNKNETKVNLKFQVEMIGDVNVILMESLDDLKILGDEIKNRYEKIVMCLVSKNKVLLSSKNVDIDCRIWLKSLESFGLKGGGKKDFVSSGSKDMLDSTMLLNVSRKFLENNLIVSS